MSHPLFKYLSLPKSDFALPRMTIQGLLCLALLFTIANSNASEELTTEQWKQFNINTVEHYIVPNYVALEVAAEQLHAANQLLCNTPTKDKLEASKSSFIDTMAAWQAIQNVRFGPVEISERHYSMQFWPDKKNHIGKRLKQLITSQDSASLGDSFTTLPISIKGLPAIERLLFSENLLSDDKTSLFECEVLNRISLEVHTVTKALATEWQNQMVPQFNDAKQLDGYFEDDIDAATTLLKALVEPIEHIRDLKLQRPLGSDIKHTNGKRLESWRSKQSKQNLEYNLASLKQFYTLAGTNGEATSLRKLIGKDALLIDKLFEQTEHALNRIATPMHESIETPSGFAAASELLESLTQLHQQLSSTLTEMGIHLGFNSRDGD